MKILRSVKEYQKWRSGIECKTLGFVPTLGALHAGHAALLKQARAENEVLVLSIFINPTQFNQTDDYEKYPKTEDADFAMAKESRVDALFFPDQASDLYPDDYAYRVHENTFSKTLCGAFRPGHFEGMLTVVLKLLKIVSPTHAYFGEKDFQQLRLVQDMAQALFLPIDVVACETLREADGLAMSSRNVRLRSAAREKASLISKYLKSSLANEEVKAKLAEAGFEVEYVATEMGRRLVAAKLDGVRLIDNVKI